MAEGGRVAFRSFSAAGVLSVRSSHCNFLHATREQLVPPAATGRTRLVISRPRAPKIRQAERRAPWRQGRVHGPVNAPPCCWGEMSACLSSWSWASGLGSGRGVRRRFPPRPGQSALPFHSLPLHATGRGPLSPSSHRFTALQRLRLLRERFPRPLLAPPAHLPGAARDSRRGPGLGVSWSTSLPPPSGCWAGCPSSPVKPLPCFLSPLGPLPLRLQPGVPPCSRRRARLPHPAARKDVPRTCCSGRGVGAWQRFIAVLAPLHCPFPAGSNCWWLAPRDVHTHFVFVYELPRRSV